jgi:monoamine oxidase
VNRRTAIKQLGFGLSTGFVLPSLLSACGEKDPGPEVQYDGVVGIIGAGAAGLFAADILRTKGVKVRLFEAANRVGGRIYSIRAFNDEFDSFPRQDFPIEIGAERVLGSDGSWADVIKLLNVPTVEYRLNSTPNYIIDGVLKTEAEALLDPDFVAAQNLLADLKNISGSTVQSAIVTQGISPRMYAILNSLIGNEFGTDNSLLGANGLGEALTLRQRNTTELILRDNPMQDILISRFAQTVDLVELNKQVKSVTNTGDSIDLTITNTLDGTEENITVNKLIVAVPLSILKAGDISFSPSLPSDKQEAMSKIGVDSSLRVVLDFRQNLWGTDRSFIVGGTQGPLYFNAGVGRSEFNKILSVTVNGPKATELGALGNDAVNELILELDGILGSKASENVKDAFIIKDWGADQYIKGGYSYPKDGGNEEDRLALAAPINGNVFFAGEATDIKGDWGTVNGALNSGERVALEVIDAIVNPPV